VGYKTKVLYGVVVTLVLLCIYTIARDFIVFNELAQLRVMRTVGNSNLGMPMPSGGQPGQDAPPANPLAGQIVDAKRGTGKQAGKFQVTTVLQSTTPVDLLGKGNPFLVDSGQKQYPVDASSLEALNRAKIEMSNKSSVKIDLVFSFPDTAQPIAVVFNYGSSSLTAPELVLYFR